MRQFNFEIKNPNGLHTRPGTELVRLAKTFSAEITLRKEEKTANLKSLIKLLKIGISQNDSVEIVCSGDDEIQASEAIRAFLEQLTE